jgi:hypothetical protein
MAPLAQAFTGPAQACRRAATRHTCALLKMSERGALPRRGLSAIGVAAVALALLDTAQPKLGRPRPAFSAGLLPKTTTDQVGALSSRLASPVEALQPLKKVPSRPASFPAWLEGTWDVAASTLAVSGVGGGQDVGGIEEALRGVVGAGMRFVADGKGGAAEDRGYGARAAAEQLSGLRVLDARCPPGVFIQHDLARTLDSCAHGDPSAGTMLCGTLRAWRWACARTRTTPPRS